MKRSIPMSAMILYILLTIVYFSKIKFSKYLTADAIKFFRFFAFSSKLLRESLFNFLPLIKTVVGFCNADKSNRGAGEILFTSMNNDGTKAGFANEALARLSDELNIPIIASGGAGTMQHFTDTFTIGKADAALAASVFHFGEIEISALKKALKNNNIPVRI
jgi:thiazole synthase ThiGH ThiG subunit